MHTTYIPILTYYTYVRCGSISRCELDKKLESREEKKIFFLVDYKCVGPLLLLNLNEIRRAGVHNDGVFNECKISDQEFDDDIASINSKDNDDDADDDDD